MKKLILSILLFTLVAISASAKDIVSKDDFRRDIVRVGYQAWVTNHNATAMELLSHTQTFYGTLEKVRFNTGVGHQDLIFMRDSDGAIYDVTLAPDDNLVFDNQDLKHIVYRLLWILETADESFISSYFQSYSSSLDISFGQPGNVQRQISAFLEQVSMPVKISSWSFSETEEGVFVFSTEVGDDILRISVQPTLNLLLNGQVDILTSSIRTVIEEGASIEKFETSSSISEAGSIVRVVYFGSEEGELSAEYEKGVSNSISNWTEEAFANYLTQKWVAWHIPESFEVQSGIQNASEVGIQLEGDQIYRFQDVAAENVLKVGPLLGDGKVVVFAIDNLEVSDSEAKARMHVRYIDEQLQYIHAARITESYHRNSNSITHSDTKIDLILSIRMDNVSDLFARTSTEKKQEPLFQIRVQE